ncbi:MAG: NUDIX domain-containing protein [Patescibacteria group bacterium]
MASQCDHTSVGMLIWRDGKLLLIERKKGVLGFAPPAGHIDDHGSPEDAVRQEVLEEVGLTTTKIELLIEGRKDNACRREGGSWHHWKIYTVEASGEIARSESETKQAGFYSVAELRQLALKTEAFIRGEIDADTWAVAPGIEPVWYEWLRELKIV